MGISITIEIILENIVFNTDPQFVLKSLENEYIDTRDKSIIGLHWVRSEHLDICNQMKKTLKEIKWSKALPITEGFLSFSNTL